jgi:hypothetical protein
MHILTKLKFIHALELKINFKINLFYCLLIINFLAYSIYAVLSRYNIFLIEILVNLNFVIFFYYYVRFPNNYLVYKIELKSEESIFFIFLFLFLIILLFYELQVPLMGDEIAPTKRSARNAYFASFLFLKIFDINFFKEISFKYLIHFFSFLQIIFIYLIAIALKKKKFFNFILILLLSIFLRLLIKDATHHPPLNHIFSSFFISIFGLEHEIVRISYLTIFCFFLIFYYQLLREYLSKIQAKIFILSVASFPLLTIASVVPDHSIWSSLIFIYLISYVILEKKINFRFCILIISIGILFRISIFSAFSLIGMCFLIDSINKKFSFYEKLKQLILKEKILVIVLIFLPLFLISLLGNPAFEGVQNISSFKLFYDALNSNVIINSIIKEVPFWYYLFFIFIFFIKRKFEIIIFFILNLVIYFSINPEIWGGAKYVLEYALPFLIGGHLIFTKMLFDNKNFLLLVFLNLLIFVLNISDIQKFHNVRISGDLMNDMNYQKLLKSSDKKTKYYLKNPYRYDDGLNYIKKIKKQKNSLLLGQTYGFFPEIMEGYNFKDISAVIDLRASFDNIDFNEDSLANKINNISKKNNLFEILKQYFLTTSILSIIKATEVKFANINFSDNTSLLSKNDIYKFSNLHKIKNIEYLLLADVGNKNQLINLLLSNNWKIENKFIDKNYKSTLVLLKKIN